MLVEKEELTNRLLKEASEILSYFLLFSFPFKVSIEEMEKEKLSLQSDTENYTGQVGNLKLLPWGLLYSWVICSDSPGSCVQVERIQQKLQIMTEMYQENELKLHRFIPLQLVVK